MTNIIDETVSVGHRSAWIEDNPCTAFGGNTPTVSVERLVEFAGLDPMGINADNSHTSLCLQVLSSGAKVFPDYGERAEFIKYKTLLISTNGESLLRDNTSRCVSAIGGFAINLAVA